MSTDQRTYPTFPIPAVGAVILHENRVLLIQRGKPPSQGKWTLPGGVIEVGESPEEALIREVWEECRITVTPGKIATIVNRVTRDEQANIVYHYVILDYFAQYHAENSGRFTVPQAGSDALDVRWIPVSELSQYELTDGLLDILQPLFINKQEEKL